MRELERAPEGEIERRRRWSGRSAPLKRLITGCLRAALGGRKLDCDRRSPVEVVFSIGGLSMRIFTAVVERCPDTGLYVGYVPGFPGAHTQAETLDELNRNLQEVIEMLLEDGEPKLEAEFVGIQTVRVA